jgi:hypothetical protein
MKIGDVVTRTSGDESLLGIIVNAELYTFEDGWDGVERMDPFGEISFFVVWADGSTSTELGRELKYLYGSPQPKLVSKKSVVHKNL